MRKMLIAFTVIGLIALTQRALPQVPFHERQADKFIEYITVAEPYTKWETWPGKGILHKGKAPYAHGDFVATYVNHVALRSISKKQGMAPDSIIVMENYGPDRSLAGITTMYKVVGYNPKAGDWYWVEATPAGRVVSFGKTQACIECHGSRAENDWIWAMTW